MIVCLLVKEFNMYCLQFLAHGYMMLDISIKSQEIANRSI